MTTIPTGQTFNVAATFGVNAKPGLEVHGFADDAHPQIPVRQPYVFRPELLRDVLAYLHAANGDGLFLTGPTGSGKTSLICQIAARLNYPVQTVTCHGRLELNALIGQFVLINGSTRFVHGPLSVAARDGHLLILNESDLMDPSELAGLNDILEGQPLVIAENGGEVIQPHPQFRVFATGNTAGSGDRSGLYQGTLRQNLAFMDRFRVISVGYPDADTEKQVVLAAAPKLPLDIIDKMLRVAEDIRRLFLGSSEGEPELTLTMSTRTLVRWATLSLTFKGAPNVFEYALTQALTARAEPEQQEAIHRIAADIFGDYWQATP
ncbi:AAA family ATPase [Thiocystis violascens]|uniref:ATPase family protein associated with various cellular activities (AAA) n=1 Tax=Thiocystis violascens (strain ATCC 17096 / DSM 198 / 6111) TaxID=765911 RepID=I3Y6L6_THIV6|nr:AAA family ATPase [Thiocystis violascens]AFL72634.1 ATPase family protein associated with various cellular activities (AAA) [Thiocystis violascens DSM 198]